MTTSIKINTNKLTSNSAILEADERQYNESKTQGVQRIGRLIDIPKSSIRKKSGVVGVFGALKVFFKPNDEIEYNIVSVEIESKISQGISVKNLRDTDGDSLPFMYIGYNLPYGDSINERIYPKLNFSNFGTQEFIKRDEFLPYLDDSFEYEPDLYIKSSDEYRSNIFPVAIGSFHKRYENHFKTQGTIDPLEIRRRYVGRPDQRVDHFANTLSNRGYFFGIAGDIAGSTENNTHGGNTPITSLIESDELQNQQSLRLINFDDTNQTVRLNTDLKPIPFSTNVNESTTSPYDDSFDYTKGKYSFYGQGLSDIIYGDGIKAPYTNASEIGTRYVSTTSGFVYESTTIKNTTLGTDSIAFGGLARR